MSEKKKIYTAKTKKPGKEDKHAIVYQKKSPVKTQGHASEVPFHGSSEKSDSERLLNARSESERMAVAMQLQRNYGNAYVQRLLDSVSVQTKLTVSQPDDPLEVEADNVAQEVTQKAAAGVQRQESTEDEEEPLQAKISRLQRQESTEDEEESLQAKISRLQRQESTEDEEESLQAKAAGKTLEVDDQLENRIKASRGLGEPLEDATRKSFEPHFGADFSEVKIHTGSEADKLSRRLQAEAFTTGKDIFFKEGRYHPGSDDGKRLLAHELTHVIQQTGAGERLHRQDEPKTGLAVEKSIEKFGGKAKTVFDDWSRLSPEQRMSGLIAAVNIELTKARVPMVKGVFKDCGGAGNAEFDFETWTVNVDPVTPKKDSVSAEEMSQFADAVYHESRHAEQWYRIARLRSGEGLTANQLVKELYIPANIASEAAKDPLKPLGPEARRVRSEQFVKLHDQTLKEAQAWYDSIYGANSENRNEVLGDIANRYDEYRALAEEVDAWAVGTKAQNTVKNLLGG